MDIADAVFSLLCLVPCVLPFILGVLGLWLFRRWSMRGFQSAIVIDGATCLSADDGSVVIRKRTGFNLFALVFLGLCLLGSAALLWSAIGDLLRGDLTPTPVNVDDFSSVIVFVGAAVSNTWHLLLAVALVGVAVLILARSLRMPSIHINTGSQMLEMGRGKSSRRIPFSSVSFVVRYDSALGFLGMVLESNFGGTIGIGVVLNSGDVVQLGTVSGSKAAERADAIARLIAGAMGAPVRRRLPVSDKLPRTIKCPKCGGETYRSIGGKDICPSCCGYGSSLLMEVLAETNVEPVRSVSELERLAYHEAGHAVMSYLLRQGHTNERTIPLDEFEKVTIRGEKQDWSKITASLDSLISAAQVLIAGPTAERIKCNLPHDVLYNDSVQDKSTARRLIASFVDEMTGEDAEAVREITPRIFQDRSELAEIELRCHWPAVDALAQVLLKRTTLVGKEAVKIIEAAMAN